jgi:hypothetical protein
MRRWLTAAIPLILLAGCAQGGTAGAPQPGSGDADFDRKAAEVAEAWRASQESHAPQDGFVPLEPLTVLPAGATFSNDTKLAYGNGWFRSIARLSTKAPSGGSIRFADGTAMSVPLISAAEAYRAIDKGDPPCNGDGGIPPAVQLPVPESPPVVKRTATPSHCTALTVTGAKLATVQLRTTRGEATVPAWLFTVDELAVPVARVAVAPTAITSPPPGGLPMPGMDSVTVDGTRLTYPILTGCAKEIKPLVYEAEDLVVVGAKITPVDGVCPAIAKVERVTVTLKEPLGDRVVLDSSGRQLRR